jgi:hypothetical protein
MRKSLLWVGSALCFIGAATIITSAVLSYFGVSGSYNFGNPEKFEFVLVPFWQIGLVIAAIGGAFVLIGRWLNPNG